MDRQMMKNDSFGIIDIVGETANYTPLNWMDFWDSLGYISNSRINIDFLAEKKWDAAIERILKERIDAWETLAKL